MICQLLLNFNPFNWQIFYDKSLGIVYDMETRWLYIIAGVALANFLIILFWEYIVVPKLSLSHHRKVAKHFIRRMTIEDKLELKRKFSSDIIALES